jgi:kinesin family protein 23
MLKCVFKPNKYNGFSVQPEEDAERARSRLSPPAFTVYDRIMESKKVFGYNREMACSVFVSYVEIYNDICYDLLDDSDQRTSKTIRTDARGINYVEGAAEVEVSSSEEVIAQHLKAQDRRKIAATLLNATSSRSHSIFNIRLVMAPLRDDGSFYPVSDDSQVLILLFLSPIHFQVLVSQLSLVDLAGSERSKRTENKGERLMERYYVIIFFKRQLF